MTKILDPAIQDYLNGICCPEPVVPLFNFDVTADWANGDPNFPVTDQASFEAFLANRSYNNTNDLTSIVITDFNLQGNRLQCNLIANGTILDISEMVVTEFLSIGDITSLQFLNLSGNQIVTFNPSIALPSSLQVLYLSNNQIIDFNPSIALPSSLQILDLGSNQIVTFNPNIALPNNLQELYLYNNQIVTFNPTIVLPISLVLLGLNDNQMTTFNPTIALPSSLQELRLNNNQIVTFNPTIALPSSLVFLGLNDNQMTTSGYNASESWANGMHNAPSGGTIELHSNINSASGTNLETILTNKGWTVQA
jgi:Leucine-rich repeat (LRR) protein